MKKTFSWVAGFLLLGWICAVSVVADDTYYFEAEAFGLLKHLLDGGDTVTTKGDSGAGPFATGATVKDIDDATESFEMGGGRLTMGRVLNERDSVEFSLMGFNHSSHSFIEDPDTDLDAAFTVSGGFLTDLLCCTEFDGARAQRLDYATLLVSAEFNFRRQVNQMFSILGGIRYVHLSDNLFFTTDDDLVIEVVDADGTVDIDGENDMFGLQVGVDAEVPIGDKFTVNGGLKAGAFVNVASIDSIIFDDDTLSFGFEDTKARGSAITEGKIGLGWKVTPNVAINLGYMAMLLSWVTTAGNNFPQDNTMAEFQSHDSDHVLVHGPLARINILLP